MKKPEYFENDNNNPKQNMRTTLVALGDPYLGLKKQFILEPKIIDMLLIVFARTAMLM